MPEGPEIRRAADKIERVVLGQRANEVFFAFPRLKPFSRKLAGRTISRIETRGKAMLSWFDDELAVFSHNQLYGRWMVKKKPGLPKTNRQLRFAVHTDAGSALLYSASQIEVLDQRGVLSHPFLSRLGPDPLDRNTTAQLIRRRLQSNAFRGRQLASLLLDQAFMSGIGNYLRSEILFVSGLDPCLRPADLEPEALGRLARAINQLTRRAYRTGGITTDAAYAKAMKRHGYRRREYRHYVFARGGHACLECGHQVVHDQLAGRRIYYCEQCQPWPQECGRDLG